MIVGVSANLLSRRTASPDQGRRAFGVWAFAAIGSPVALARAATLPTVASLRFGAHAPLEADGRGFVFYLVGYAAGRKAALVLKGLNAGDIPLEPMQQFSMDINPRPAAAQGLVLTPELPARADRVHL